MAVVYARDFFFCTHAAANISITTSPAACLLCCVCNRGQTYQLVSTRFTAHHTYMPSHCYDEPWRTLARLPVCMCVHAYRIHVFYEYYRNSFICRHISAAYSCYDNLNILKVAGYSTLHQFSRCFPNFAYVFLTNILNCFSSYFFYCITVCYVAANSLLLSAT